MKLNEEQLKAIVQLENDRNFQIFLGVLDNYRQEALEYVMFGQEGSIQTSRGVARAVTEIMRAVGGARTELAKFN